MAVRKTPPLVAESDAMRIVPLYGHAPYEAAAPAAPAKLTYRNGPLMNASVTDRALQAFLKQQSAAATVPKPTANTLYFIYLPPGVRVVMGGSSSCQAFCGYHNSIGSRVFYAVMPYPGCTGCAGELAPFDALTSTSSHELCEAITDPIPGQGWYDDANGEIGDICAWQMKEVGSYTVQLEWSNNASACL